MDAPTPTILVLENCDNLQDKATASEYSINSIPNGYTTAGIKIGESFTIEELLEVMMLRSANEAATILAEYIAGSLEEFAKLMNQKAKEIGALDSNFLNANGMHDDNHYSTTYDMALIERYCMQNEDFRRISGLTSCSLPNTSLYEGEPRVFKNTHAFLLPESPNYYKYAIAGKTGYTTPAKNCLVTCANKNGFELIAVVLHAEGKEEGVSARYSDSKKLLDYGYNNFRISEFLKAGDVVDKITIKTVEGKKEELNLVLAESVKILCGKKEGLSKSSGNITLKEIELPIKKGDVLGTVNYKIKNNDYTIEVLADRNIELEAEVKKVTIETDKTSDYIFIGLIFGLIFISIIVIIIFIIVAIKERKQNLNYS